MGDRPTMVDVARAAGVSTALVSIVMRGVPGASERTRARVLAVADGIGYVPDQRASRLRQASSRLIGVSFGLRHAFHGDLVEQLYVAAAEHGLDLALGATAPGRDEDVAARALLRERPEALVLLGPTLGIDDLARLAARVGVVTVARRVDVPRHAAQHGGRAGRGTPRVASASTDEAAGVDAAVAHLVGLGHRAIAHVDGGDAPGAGERRAAFVAAVRRAGLPEPTVLGGGPDESDGIRVAAALVAATEPPTAVVAFNDACAVGILDALRRAGRAVPATTSLVGLDDSRLAGLAHVALTTVAQDVPGLARAAVAAAVDLAAGGDGAATVLDPHLVVRTTTGPPPVR